MSQELAHCLAFSTHFSEHESFFHYDSGRWLYNEKEREYRKSRLPWLLVALCIDAELAARYAKFKVDALQRVAANAVGAERCISMVKSNEGV
jgi:hypothetical protein